MKTTYSLIVDHSENYSCDAVIDSDIQLIVESRWDSSRIPLTLLTSRENVGIMKKLVKIMEKRLKAKDV